MIARLCRRLTFANVCSLVALLVALGTGGAYAANTVFSTDIVNGEVKPQDLAPNAVHSARIADGEVQTGDLAQNSVHSGKIDDGQVGTADLAIGAVDQRDLARNAAMCSAVIVGNVTSNGTRTRCTGPSPVISGLLQPGGNHGTYCFALPFTPVSAVASIDSASPGYPVAFASTDPATVGSVCGGSSAYNAVVVAYNHDDATPGATPTNEVVYAVFF